MTEWNYDGVELRQSGTTTEWNYDRVEPGDRKGRHYIVATKRRMGEL